MGELFLMKITNNRYFKLLAIIVVIAPYSIVVADSNTFNPALALISQMEYASKHLNYKGVFVYLRNDQLKAIHIVHKVDKYGEYERLTSLNGPPREIIRDKESITHILPNKKENIEGDFNSGNGFLRNFSKKLKGISKYYQFSIGRKDRVAGREAQEIIVSPRDSYRYGYHLWVDPNIGLLLKSIMMGEDDGPLEQIMFTSLSLPTQISQQELLPTIVGKRVSRKREDKSIRSDLESKKESHWRIDWLPLGFTLVAYGKHLLPNSQIPVEHLAYSDGLGSVSVFIESAIDNHQSHLHGFSTLGAINAYGTTLSKHYLTVVGDIPHAAVEKIGKSIRYIN
ncbi:Sigma factor AlgU regulatory protein MucB [Candidatus Nitrosacidococcus sp. I8]|nr:Sigma factor AlgU regulatory protein MucB [Candidatus Nitrosacidococcus sp. I8]